MRVDVFAVHHGRLQRLESTYDFSYGPHRGHLTQSMAAYKQSLLESVQANAHGHSPMEAAHRLWSLAVLSGDDALRDALVPVLSSKQAGLAQVESDTTLLLASLRGIGVHSYVPFAAIAASTKRLRRLVSTCEGADTKVKHAILDKLAQMSALHAAYLQHGEFDVPRAEKLLRDVRGELQLTVASQAKILRTLPIGGVEAKHATRHLPYRGLLPPPKVVTDELPEEQWLSSMRH